jgi:hypothetical protein
MHVTDSEPQLVKVEFRTDDEVETLWAEPLGDNRYRVDNSPFYAYGVSWRDVILTEPQPGAFPLFAGVIEKSGHRTVRVIVADSDALDHLKSGILGLGCTFEGAWHKLICIDVPPEVELERVRQYLIAGGFEWEHADPTYEQLYGHHGE